jgi:hypothetical protein
MIGLRRGGWTGQKNKERNKGNGREGGGGEGVKGRVRRGRSVRWEGIAHQRIFICKSIRAFGSFIVSPSKISLSPLSLSHTHSRRLSTPL